MLAICISTIIYMTEESMGVAVMWILLVNLFGSMWFAIYLLLRLRSGKGVALSSDETSGYRRLG